jgi:hypothetical protein
VYVCVCVCVFVYVCVCMCGVGWVKKKGDERGEIKGRKTIREEKRREVKKRGREVS